ncbi:Trypanosome variant surface glycoprotein (A-type) [Trypanosoma brucei equiperdum]|uniref:Trypanosome variant surface glycoprotein (A-type) n=1 Tax=Trypanosoma brucei equiperdum TaxID=630700 RepID=A0A3L6LAN1_9TRYP|nr:Trypanosome variant surface glycoprotein (A-type) [Trypanosoma brucei equiperdum]
MQFTAGDNTKICLLTLTALAVCVSNTDAVAADQRPLLHASYSKLCTVAAKLKKTPKRSAKLLEVMAKAAETSATAALKFRIKKAIHSKPADKAIATAIIMLLEKIGAAALHDMKSKAHKLVRAATTCTALAARISETLTMFNNAGHGSGYCLDSTTPDRSGHVAFASQDCLNDDLAVTPSDDKWEATKLKADGFADGPGTGNPVSQSSSSNSKCLLVDTGSAETTNCFGSRSRFIAGILTLSGASGSRIAAMNAGVGKSDRQDKKLLEAALEDANVVNSETIENYKKLR